MESIRGFKNIQNRNKYCKVIAIAKKNLKVQLIDNCNRLHNEIKDKYSIPFNINLLIEDSNDNILINGIYRAQNGEIIENMNEFIDYMENDILINNYNKRIFMGDYNGHHSSWQAYSKITNSSKAGKNGKILYNWLKK